MGAESDLTEETDQTEIPGDLTGSTIDPAANDNSSIQAQAAAEFTGDKDKNNAVESLLAEPHVASSSSASSASSAATRSLEQPYTPVAAELSTNAEILPNTAERVQIPPAPAAALPSKSHSDATVHALAETVSQTVSAPVSLSLSESIEQPGTSSASSLRASSGPASLVNLSGIWKVKFNQFTSKL